MCYYYPDSQYVLAVLYKSIAMHVILIGHLLQSKKQYKVRKMSFTTSVQSFKTYFKQLNSLFQKEFASVTNNRN